MNFSFLQQWFKEMMIRTEGRGRIFEFLYHPAIGEYDISADLHGHTSTYSDGERSHRLYKTSSKKRKIEKVAITDHDSIGQDDAPDGFINGVEITTHLDDNEIEILVYNYDQKTAQALIDSGEFPFLNKSFKILRNLELTKKRIEICNKLHITSTPISLNDLLSVDIEDENGIKKSIPFSQIGINSNHIFSDENPLPQNVVYGKNVYPINYNYLIRKLFDRIHSDPKGLQYLNSVAENDSSFNPHSSDDFMKTIIANKNGDLHIETDGYWPTVEQVIDFARQTGGVAVLAHPFGYNKKINITTPELLRKLYHLGIDGIEVFHGFNQSDEIEFLYKFCYEYGLLMTMGSDTHGYFSHQGGPMEPGIAPGTGYQSRFTEGNIDQTHTSLYNLHYFGTGAWRGEKEFDHLSYPLSIHEVFMTQEKITNKSKNTVKRKNKTLQESQPMA